MDRHPDWAVVVCLVGGGQEINTGEAGIGEWLRTVAHRFPGWDVYISSRLHDSEYSADRALGLFSERPNMPFCDELHLAVSMRSFRAESVSALVKHLLDQNEEQSRKLLREIVDRYRVLVTRSRQGMVIVVPAGDTSDPTRCPEYYDSTYAYLRRIGLPALLGTIG